MQVNQVNEAGTYKINGLGGAESLYNESVREQQAIWQREDAIRKETQEREDTAYERAVESARRAGINPNLIDIKPAESGGGISTGTAKDNTLTQSQMTINAEKIQANAQREFERIMALNEHERAKEIQRIEQEFEATYKDVEMKIKKRDSIWGNINDTVRALSSFMDGAALLKLLGVGK